MAGLLAVQKNVVSASLRALEMNGSGDDNRVEFWVGGNSDPKERKGSSYLAVFNLSDSPANVTRPFSSVRYCSIRNGR